MIGAEEEEEEEEVCGDKRADGGLGDNNEIKAVEEWEHEQEDI